ncbi:MAG: M28 family peptidase, partial [Chloroflexota bacterium]
PLTPSPLLFDGERAFAYLEAQMTFGPRWPGSPGHTAVRQYIVQQLEELGWAVEEQAFDYRGFAAVNLIGRANLERDPIIILGAHYDTRKVADQPTPGVSEIPEGWDGSVPGAVDGASGVAVLLELARTLDLDQIPYEIWLAFFDVEDNGSGGIADWGWIGGSTYMAENLTVEPTAVVVVDMVGDADQQLYYDGNSHPALREELWQIAIDLGYGEAFIPTVKHTMIDDHLPFARQGWPAVDIIDFDYPYWHTLEDTADKASPMSLLRVGRTLEPWLEGG